jgi:hypothetical protein
MPSVRELLAQYNKETPKMNLTEDELELLISRYVGPATLPKNVIEKSTMDEFKTKDEETNKSPYDDLYQSIQEHIKDIRQQRRAASPARQETPERMDFASSERNTRELDTRPHPPPPPSVGGRRKKTRRRKSRRRRSRKPVY